MGHHIIELNGDCVALIVSKDDPTDYQMKIMPGPDCTFNAAETWSAVQRAFVALANGGGEELEC